MRVLGHRALALLRWAPAVLAWSAVALASQRAPAGASSKPKSLQGAIVFAALASLGVAIEIAGGREHGVFPARLAYGVEVALWPLAAIGIAWAFARARVLATAASIATVPLLGLALARPPELADPDSVRAGLLLRKGALDPGAGALLVERVPRRPKLGWAVADDRARIVPFGWAAVGVLWARWPRTVWGARRRAEWELVEPTDPKGGRTTVPTRDLGAFLDRRGVTAAWISSPESVSEVMAAWPRARVLWQGEGVFLARE
jgi:hypothetical protein